mgnify:CR=1 FL=1
MHEIKKIMVAIDFSEYSARTMNYAASLARSLQAELVVINVINQADIAAVERVIAVHGIFTLDGYLQEQNESRLKLIDQLIEDAELSSVAIKKIISSGLPYVKLCESVKAEYIDLVIMGVKGRTNHPNVRFGSVAEKMFRRCPVPLLSVRGQSG